jgi:hypothetical protein
MLGEIKTVNARRVNIIYQANASGQWQPGLPQTAREARKLKFRKLTKAAWP